MKKAFKKSLFILFTVFTMAVIFCFGASALTQTGKCGDNVYYTHNSSTGELVISGSGDMYDFYDERPFSDLYIKSVVIKKGVTSIGYNAFYECSNLQNLTIADSVTSIGEEAFYNCDSLKSVTIPDSVTGIDYGAFSCCDNIETFTVPFIGGSRNDDYPYFSYIFGTDSTDDELLPGTLKEIVITNQYEDIPSYAFSDCYDVESITIYGSPDTIGDYAFSDCESLWNIVIPDSVTSIGDAAFLGCYRLQDFKINNNVHSIGHSAFAYCYDLQSVTIGNNVFYIGESAFDHCTSLKNITIGKNVGYIYDNAFGECYSLSNIYYKGTKAQWNEIYIGDYGNYSLQDATIHYNSHNLVRVSYTKATLAKNGVVVSKCTDCDYKKTTVIYYPKTFSFSPAACTYNGKVQTPAVIVKDANGKTLAKDTAYTVAYQSGRTKPGKYNVVITFKGYYSGTKTLTFSILPGKISKITAVQNTSAVKLTWTKSVGTTGYRVFRYNPSTKSWIVAVKSTKDNTALIQNLTPGTKYIFAVRPYYNTGKEIIWANYTQIQTATRTATPSIRLASTAKGRATIAWNDVNGETGYQIYYSTKASSGYTKLSNYNANVTKAYKTGLVSGRTYYFRVRTYIKTTSGYVYSSFSPVKSMKIK